jgi:hypothetical protein
VPLSIDLTGFAVALIIINSASALRAVEMAPHRDHELGYDLLDDCAKCTDGLDGRCTGLKRGYLYRCCLSETRTTASGAGIAGCGSCRRTTNLKHATRH